MSDNMVVANTILEQLGGRRFVAMTGARNFTAIDDQRGALSFKVPRAKDGINAIKVTLTAMDDYTVEAFRSHAELLRREGPDGRHLCRPAARSLRTDDRALYEPVTRRGGRAHHAIPTACGEMPPRRSRS